MHTLHVPVTDPNSSSSQHPTPVLADSLTLQTAGARFAEGSNQHHNLVANRSDLIAEPGCHHCASVHFRKVQGDGKIYNFLSVFHACFFSTIN